MVFGWLVLLFLLKWSGAELKVSTDKEELEKINGEPAKEEEVSVLEKDEKSTCAKLKKSENESEMQKTDDEDILEEITFKEPTEITAPPTYLQRLHARWWLPASTIFEMGGMFGALAGIGVDGAITIGLKAWATYNDAQVAEDG
eukprot:930834_1